MFYLRAMVLILSSILCADICAGESQPVPTDGAQGVELPVTLSFVPGEAMTGAANHVIFIGTDKTKVAEAFYRNHANVDVYELKTPSFKLSNLKPDMTYYWRVDLFNDQMEPLRTGDIWSFTTTKSDGLVFKPDLNVRHNLLADGVGGTGFDGFIGKEPGETADRIEIADGKLILASSKGRYEGDARPLGPLVYKKVQGDFKVTARIAEYQQVAFNNVGLMARAANIEDAGKGEDWVSVDYFPLYGGIYARVNDEGHRKEVCDSGQGRNADRWIQLEMQGNMFFLRHSADGVKWSDLPCNPIVRNDLVNVPLQVGVFNATFSDNQGTAAVENFTLETRPQVRTARAHSPENGQVNVPNAWRLSWIPGVGSQFHDIYLGTSREAVKAGHHQMEKGNSVYQGRQENANAQYPFSDLKDGQTYYWRIDEVDGETIHAGDVWEFTIYNRDLSDFKKYGRSAELIQAWNVKGEGIVSLVETENGKGMKLEFDRAPTDRPWVVAAEYTFGENQNWFSSLYAFRSLRIAYKGKMSNGADRLSLIFEDNDWGARRTVVECPDSATRLCNETSTVWDVDLQQLVQNNPTFRLTDVKKMSVAVGAPAGKAGSVIIEGITINTQRDSDKWPTYINAEKFVEAVPFDKVKVTDGLWRERMDVNRKVSLPHVWGRCESSLKDNGEVSKRLDNFRKAAGEMEGGFTGIYFNDSDVYKIIEGTAYSLQMYPDAELEAYTDKVIASIAGAQWEDGYLYTFYSLPKRQPDQRWTNVGGMHELYCAGHLFEAAVAYYKATGKRKLLEVAIRFADNICETFGPGKRTDPPGHQEVEIGLMKLYEATEDRKYMEMARFFIDARGRSVNGRVLYGEYSQDHIPFVEQEKGVGHSVRAGYMFCAATDVLMKNRDEAYANSTMRLWDNITNTKTYLTGGIGQPGGPEGFSGEYELGNDCYAETCSGIAFALWNHRLHKMTGESKYMDFAERILLNNTLSSLSFEGNKHYYTNPLTTDGRERWEWPGHDCACCPSSLVRTIASISGYVYTHNQDTIIVNMFMPSEGTISMGDNPVSIKQETGYPWFGDVKLTLNPKKSAKFSVKLRIPSWARNEPIPGNLYKYLDDKSEPVTVKVNDKAFDALVVHGYLTLDRQWESGDAIELSLPMSVRRVVCHPNAKANEGLVAIERGPIVYCAEFKDNEGLDVRNLKISDDVTFDATYEKDFFNGVITLKGNNGIKLIPYYLYANRGKGWMRVWMPRK